MEQSKEPMRVTWYRHCFDSPAHIRRIILVIRIVSLKNGTWMAKCALDCLRFVILLPEKSSRTTITSKLSVKRRKNACAGRITAVVSLFVLPKAGNFRNNMQSRRKSVWRKSVWRRRRRRRRGRQSLGNCLPNIANSVQDRWFNHSIRYTRSPCIVSIRSRYFCLDILYAHGTETNHHSPPRLGICVTAEEA